MISRFRFYLLLFIAPLLVACGSDEEQGQRLSHLQVSGRWAPLPAPLYISDEIAQNRRMMRDVREAAAFWERAAQKKLFDFRFDWEGPVPPFSGTYDSPTSVLTNLLFFVDPWPLDPNIKGQTILVVRGEEVQNAMIYINREDYCVGSCLRDTRISFRRLLAHEFGHYLGIRHSGDPEDIMFPHIPIGEPLSTAKLDLNVLRMVVR